MHLHYDLTMNDIPSVHMEELSVSPINGYVGLQTDRLERNSWSMSTFAGGLNSVDALHPPMITMNSPSAPILDPAWQTWESFVNDLSFAETVDAGVPLSLHNERLAGEAWYSN